MVDRRDLGPLLRERLQRLMERQGLSRAAFAQSIGVDRSALTELLDQRSTRLPRIETLFRIASIHAVSLDWLLGRTDDAPMAARMLPLLEIAAPQETGEDSLLARWHQDALGYKIRYVPQQIPDFMRTPTVIDHEYTRGQDPLPRTQIREAQSRLAYNRLPETDMEVCLPRQRLELLAAGNGVWSDLGRAERREQMERIGALVEELYPSLRLYLYDGLKTYSAPYTVFGPQRAALFVGDMYLVLNGTEHVKVLTRHFDKLIRAAVVGSDAVAGWLARLVVR